LSHALVVGRIKVILLISLHVAAVTFNFRTSLFEAERYDIFIQHRVHDKLIPAQNLFPVQIENALTADEGVLEAAAVAVPDDEYGEVVGAWIVRRAGTAGDALTREAVKRAVTERINPQVSVLCQTIDEVY
jgi:acyl-CoA synthetase (AMP-forming)/AMP-acid ligase II